MVEKISYPFSSSALKLRVEKSSVRSSERSRFSFKAFLLKLTCPSASNTLTKSLTETSKKWYRERKMWKLLTKRTSLHSSFFRDLKLPVKIDDVRSGTMDMVPLVPRLLSLPPSRKEEEREPWARGCPHKSARCELIRTFAPSLVLQNIYAIITKSYKKSFRASRPLFTFMNRKEKMTCP